MAKNERNFIPKTGRSYASQFNGAASTPAAPLPLWQAGAEGGKLYAGKFVNSINASVVDVYWSPDGITFVKIYTTPAAYATYALFVDFWTSGFVLDADGNKYVNFEAGGGFFIDATNNGTIIDVQAYGEDY